MKWKEGDDNKDLEYANYLRRQIIMAEQGENNPGEVILKQMKGFFNDFKRKIGIVYCPSCDKLIFEGEDRKKRRTPKKD